jgi:SNF2 family DNA or RNA helicase
MWGEREVVPMIKVVGYEAAGQKSAEANAGILRAAEKLGVRMDAAAKRVLADYQERVVRARQWQKLDELAPLSKLEGRLFSHQRVALQFFRMMDLPAYLNADKTGVGKTLPFLVWAHTQVKSRRILIITRNVAKEQWADAIHHWIGKKEQVLIIDGKVSQQIEQIGETNYRWTIGHWESLVHARHAYIRQHWDVIGLDEAHLANNRKAQRSKTVFKLKSEKRMAMTAHPFNRDAGELFAILRFLYPHIYKSYWRFFHMHVKASPRPFGGFDIEGLRRPKLLKWEIAPFTISRTKQDVFKSLPQVTYARVTTELTTRGRSEYQKLRKELFAEIAARGGGTLTLPILNDMVSYTRIRQYVVDPGLIGGREKSLKYDAVLDLWDQIRAPTVVFTGFAKAALALAAFLTKRAKLRTGIIKGGMLKQVPRIKRSFLDGKYDALICVDKAADTALNLGGYGYVIHLDLPALPRDYEQAVGRVDRPREKTGELVPTTAYRIITANTFEERREATLVNKDDTFREIFTAKDLLGLFEDDVEVDL